MEIHGNLINGTKCLIVILTNSAAASSSLSSSWSKEQQQQQLLQHDSNRRPHQIPDNIPYLISSILNGNINMAAKNSSAVLRLDANNNSTTVEPSSQQHQQPVDEFLFDDVDYTLDIVLPLIVGLVVAMILGWMLVRYKMSAHQRSNYNGSIYCCPEECYLFCGRFFKCNLRGFKWPKLKKRRQTDENNAAPIAPFIFNFGNIAQPITRFKNDFSITFLIDMDQIKIDKITL